MPVCFPSAGETFENEPSVTTGWGATYFGTKIKSMKKRLFISTFHFFALIQGGPATRYLLEVFTPILSDRDCQARYTTGQLDPATQVCSGGNNQGACQVKNGFQHLNPSNAALMFSFYHRVILVDPLPL